MERQAAEQITSILYKAAQDIADTVDLYRGHHAGLDPKPFSDAIGTIMAAIYDATAPIIAEYPDLAPKPTNEV